MHSAADWEIVALCIELVSRGRTGFGEADNNHGSYMWSLASGHTASKRHMGSD